MGVTIYYKSTRRVTAEEADVIRSAARNECHQRSWLSCEPVSFFLELQNGTLTGGSKPNLAAHRADKPAARELPDGTARNLLDVLARLSKEHSVDWELMLDSSPIGLIRSGRIDPRAVKRVKALAGARSSSLDHREYYGAKTAQLLRKIETLCSAKENGEWWEREVGWRCDNETAWRKAQARYDELLQRAKENGWEIR